MGDTPCVPAGINGGEESDTVCVGILHSPTISFTRLAGVIVLRITGIQTVFVAMPYVHITRNRLTTVVDINQFYFYLQRYTRFVFSDIFAQYGRIIEQGRKRKGANGFGGD